MLQKRNSINIDKTANEEFHRRRSMERDEEQQFIIGKEEGREYLNIGPKFGKRHVEAIYYFLAVFISFCVRVQLSLTIVAMTNPNANENKDIPTFDWKNRNVILSSFFWGYVIPQVVAGWLMTRYGPKWFLIATVGMGSLVGFLMPSLAIHWGSTAIIVCRVLQGFCQGFMIPSVACFMSRWIPPSETGRIGAFIYAAGSLGTVFGMMIAGSISASTYGWPMVFHFFSILGILWCLLYSFCGCNSPAEHATITVEEKAYIEKTSMTLQKRKLRTPWKKIFSSVPFLALLFSSTTFILGFWTLLTQIPTYMNKILLFDVESNGFLSALQYVAQWLVSTVLSIISDNLTNKNKISITAARKICTGIGMIIPAISLIFLGQISKDNTALGVTLLVIAVGSNGATICGTFVNNVDLSTNFAGVIQGVVNGFSNIFGILAPLIVQVLVTDEDNPEHWLRIFYLASGVYVIGAIVFAVFGSGDTQPWNDDKKDEDDDKA